MMKPDLNMGTVRNLRINVWMSLVSKMYPRGIQFRNFSRVSNVAPTYDFMVKYLTVIIDSYLIKIGKCLKLTSAALLELSMTN